MHSFIYLQSSSLEIKAKTYFCSIMVYISSDGSVNSKPKFTIVGFITGILSGIYNFCALFLSTITGNPAQIQVNQNRGSTGSRLGAGNGAFKQNRKRGGNIRQVKNLGESIVFFDMFSFIFRSMCSFYASDLILLYI